MSRGDLFEFSAADGRLGYGIVIIPGGVLYVVFLKTMHSSRPSDNELLADKIALVGTTMDALFFHGRWTVIKHNFPIPPAVPFPNWKVEIDGKVATTNFEGNQYWPIRPDEIELLDYKTSRAPIGFQNALEAINGLQEWRDSYEELTLDYVSQRVTRS